MAPPGLNPLIVQGDLTLLLDVHSPLADDARASLAPFAELLKSPEHLHTYRITPLSIWNARAAGLAPAAMVETLRRYARHPLPDSAAAEIEDLGSRYGRTRLERNGSGLLLRVADRALAESLARDEAVSPLLGPRRPDGAFEVAAASRGILKQALVRAGYPAEDVAGYERGDALSLRLRPSLVLRRYQREAADVFARAGDGVVVLPCGAGKTIVGMAAMAALGESTLVLTTSRTSVAQWRRELTDKTDLDAGAVAEYTGEVKETGPVTLTTYQILTWRPGREDGFPHFALFRARPWGLILYDEVHLLPAPVFRITAELQARRRLGLTATLVREDGREGDVFALIGPKRYDVPWRELEREGYIAAADCTEIRVPQDAPREMEYALAPRRQRFRVAAENPAKRSVLGGILARESGRATLVIGEFLSQLDEVAGQFGLPLVTGKTLQAERERLYGEFRAGKIPALALSRVGNFALDLPDAEVLVQISGIYGSRQEEAQRLGRILRPKRDGRRVRFYTLVSRRTCEEDFARNRQRFLTEQGYSYRIEIREGP